MQCRKIQELLKADYLDGELNPREQQYIKEHLVRCPQCRRLEEKLYAQHMIFQKVKRQQVPERVWQNISDAIVMQRLNQESSVNRGIFERLRDAILAPRPVFALASAVTVIIFVLVFAGNFIQKRQSFSKVNGGENIIEYNFNIESEDFVYDLGTNIEKYFL